jgi:hypothetical protein
MCEHRLKGVKLHEVRDEDDWEKAVAEEAKQKEQLAKVSAKWNTIIEELE